MIYLFIHSIPTCEDISYVFDEGKSFGDLKNDLEEKLKIEKDKYYFEMNDHVMNDDMILKDNGVINNSFINAVDNNYIKIKLNIKYGEDSYREIQNYILISDFKVLETDENKEIKVC